MRADDRRKRTARASHFLIVASVAQLLACTSPKKEFETTVCNALTLSHADARRPDKRAKQAIQWLFEHVKTDKVKSAVGMIRYDGMDPAKLGGILRYYNDEKIGADVAHCPFLDFLEKDVQIPGPVVSVQGMNVLVGDHPAGTLDEAKAAKASGTPVKLVDLSLVLHFIESSWKSENPEKTSFPGILVLDFDPSLDDFYRQSIVFTAHDAGWNDLRKATW